MAAWLQGTVLLRLQTSIRTKMSILKNIIIIGSVVLSPLCGTSASAQDLLARQAPVDRKMKEVDTLMLQNLTLREILESPAEDLYLGWDNEFFRRGENLPDTFRVDLRHFCMPTVSRALTSNFGRRHGRRHEGLDIKVYTGDTIRAAFSGKVRRVRYDRGGYGYYVVIRHPNGLETLYGHLSKQLVSEDDDVRAGDVIGLGGNTGRSSGSHLHFETRLCGVPLNPVLMFDFRAQDVVGDFYTFNRYTYDEESLEATRERGVIGNGGYTPDQVRGTSGAQATDYDSHETAQADRDVLYHKVRRGETLSSIARKRHTTVDKLCRMNRITKRTNLRPGQILRYS